MLLAQADGGGGTELNWEQLLNFGVLGLLVLMALTGWIWFKPAVDQLKERAQRAEAQRDAMAATIEHEVIPALNQASNMVDVVTKLVEETQKLHAEVRAKR